MTARPKATSTRKTPGGTAVRAGATSARGVRPVRSIRSVAILGLGVIGGSLALAIRKSDPSIVITGYARPTALEAARARSIADTYTGSIEEAVRDADCVFLCTPVHTILDMLPEVAAFVKEQAIVTDVGSTKEAICLYAKKLFKKKGIFVGGHPMAGSEGSGVGYADALLFQNAVYVLCPRQENDAKPLARLVQTFGARVMVMKPAEHDRIAACISHVPQLAAVALMNAAGKRNKSNGAYLQLAAGGFRDMTRIASSPYAMWNDILATNTKQIRLALSDLETILFQYEQQLGDRDLGAFERDFTRAKALRDRIPKNVKGFMAPLFDIYVSAEDRPGILGEIATALSSEGINIKDIELLKIREGESGTFRMSFDTAEAAERAVAALAKINIKAGR